MQLVGTFGDLLAAGVAYEHISVGPPDLPPFDECLRRRATGRVPGTVAMMDRLDVRLHPDHTGCGARRPQRRGRDGRLVRASPTVARSTRWRC